VHLKRIRSRAFHAHNVPRAQTADTVVHRSLTVLAAVFGLSSSSLGPEFRDVHTKRSAHMFYKRSDTLCAVHCY